MRIGSEPVGAGTEGVGVGEDGVDLPAFTAGAGDPDLVLGGEAAGGVDLFFGEQAFIAEPGDFVVHGVAGRDFDAEVVEGAAVVASTKVVYESGLIVRSGVS